LILVLSVAVAYTLNIGHRLFPRDATEDLPSRQVLFPVSTRRHFVPDFSSPGFPLAGPAFGLRQCCASLPFQPLPQPCPAGRLVDTAGHPSRKIADTHPRTRRTRREAVP